MDTHCGRVVHTPLLWWTVLGLLLLVVVVLVCLVVLVVVQWHFLVGRHLLLVLVVL